MLRLCKLRSTISYIIIFVCIMLAVPSKSVSKDIESRHLFKIERSKNANVVQYDVQLTPDGKIYSKEPVIAYWIRLAKDGQRKELSFTQRRWAYGFETNHDADDNFVILSMRANIGRKIKVYAVEGVYRGETRIDGCPAFIEKIYITTIEGGMLPKVQSIELCGQDTLKRVNRCEIIKP